MQLTTEEQELRRKFENWAMKIQTNFIESPLFQPVGLELSCTALVLETKCDCQIAHGDVPEDSLPIAYYRPGTDSIHVFIEHSAFRKRESDQEKYAFLMFLLFHEANHRLLLHIRRGKGKDATLWNIAADMEIHNMLYVYYEIMKSNVTHQASGIWRCMANYVRRRRYTIALSRAKWRPRRSSVWASVTGTGKAAARRPRSPCRSTRQRAGRSSR